MFTDWIYRHYVAETTLLDIAGTTKQTNIVLDLVTLYLYYYLLESVKDFSTVLGILPVIFGFALISSYIFGVRRIRLRKDSFWKAVRNVGFSSDRLKSVACIYENSRR